MSILPQIRSILIATDMTHRSVDAIRNAAELAITANARLHVVHAHEEPAAFSADPKDNLTIQRHVHEKRVELDDLLKELLPPATELGSVRVRIGAPSAVILDEVAEVGADLVVLGQHRHRGLADRFIGTTAELVVRELDVPCLLLTRPLDLPIRKAFVPSDLSAPARRAAAVALEWTDLLGRHEETEVELAHVLDPVANQRKEEWVEEELRTELESTFRDASERAGVQFPFDVQIVRASDPAVGLMRRAEEIEADLIVMGTHGDTALVRAFLGSVSSALVRRSRLPVMIVPPGLRADEATAEADGQDRQLAGVAAG